MSEADFPPIKHERSTVLCKLLAGKQRKMRLQPSLKTLHSVSSKCKHFKENSLHSLNAFLEKFKQQKLSVCFQFYRLNQSPLLYAESFAFLIKLSKHRPPTGFVLLPEILKLSANVLAWKTMDLVDRNLRLPTK